MEGKWKVTLHKFTYFTGQYNEVSCDTTLYETGEFEFQQVDEYGGTFTFTPSSENRPIGMGHVVAPMSGTFELTDLKTSVVFYLYPEGGGTWYKYIQIIDFGKRDQVWYADYSLNIEGGGNEILYVEKTR